MSEEQSLTATLKKYHATLGEASSSNEAVEHSPAGDLVLERKVELQLKTVVINGVKTQLAEDKLGYLLTIVSKETSRKEEERKEQEQQERLEKEIAEKERVEKEQKEKEEIKKKERKERAEREKLEKEKEKKEKKKEENEKKKKGRK